MEATANALSLTSNTFIVAESATSIFAYGPSGVGVGQWFNDVVGEGNFTVDSDKVALGPVAARDQGPFHKSRYHLFR